jgi:isobutyryl-CoA mutase
LKFVQLLGVSSYLGRFTDEYPAMLKRLQKTVIENLNVLEVLMNALRVCSLGQITNALFEVGKQYRRNM